MGAANAKIENLSNNNIYISQHNFSDHLLFFPTVFLLSPEGNNTNSSESKSSVVLKAGADSRGSAFWSLEERMA